MIEALDRGPSFLGGRAEYPTIPGEPKKGLQIGQALIMVGHGNGQGGRPFEGLAEGEISFRAEHQRG